MKIIELNYPKVPGELKTTPITLALGFFDGFHRGHQALVREAVYRAEQNGSKTAVYTFDRYPKPTHCGFAKGSIDPGAVCEGEEDGVRGLLQTQQQKTHRLMEEGIDFLLIQDFTDSFKQLSPVDFLDYVTKDLLQAKHILVGEDFRFGKGASGTIETLRAYCEDNDIRLTAIPSVNFMGEPISSTRIREAVRDGDFALVSQLLGRNYALRGEVIHGNRLGRSFDFPTANFRPEAAKILPPYGVYVTRTKIDGRSYPSITNIGVRPTVNVTDPDPLVETTIFGTNHDLYGTKVEVDFLQFIREEMRFRSFLIMTTQIHRDIEEARQWHARSEDLHLAYKDQANHLFLCQTERFREGTFDLYFYLPLDDERSAARALLSRLLTRSSAQYPQRRKFLQALDASYGASFNARTFALGSTQVIHFHVSSISRGLEGRRPLNEAINLVIDALLMPNVDENGLFSEEAFEAEKKSYLAELQLLRDRKTYEAESLLLQELFSGTPLAVDPLGEREQIENVTREEIRDAWDHLRRTAQMDGIIAGSYTQELVTHIIEAMKELRLDGGELYELVPGRCPKPAPAFEMPNRPLPSALEALSPYVTRKSYPGKGRSIVQLAYGGMPAYVSSDVVTFEMMWKVLGGSSHSRLLTRLRDELAAVYRVDVRPQLYNGILVIELTCEPDQTESLALEVLKEVDRLQTELISEEELREQRKLADNEYRMGADNLERLVQLQYQATITGRAMNIIDHADLLHTAEPEMIRRHAQALTLRKIFIYDAADGELLQEGEQDE